ncbi:MAG: tRNA (guanosine(46)-N7)-methyltransferase TrmB [Bacteroidales bacterium]|nr:tRNA (guanosine(46)-N7)-methyltransferase TrmB [Bacteroidales bacterium]
MATFNHVVQPKLEEILNKDHFLKNNWNRKFFSNNNPVIIELGCGKGEYTVGLAHLYPEKNFIGIDIKGSRMWKGAKTALDENLINVGFLRTRIEFITSFFGLNEIEGIWLTFPDPQLKKPRKRLTSSRYLNLYRFFLKKEGIIQLKTDNTELYEYTLRLAKYNKFEIQSFTDDLYGNEGNIEARLFQTHYETMFLKEKIPIKYIKFKLNDEEIKELPDGE